MKGKVTLSISLLLCFSVVAYGGYSDCGSEVGAIVSVDISGCGRSTSRCILKRSTNATLELSFTTNVDATTLTAVVHGIILGVPMPFDLPNPNGCQDSGITCPIKGGNTYKYRTTMPISSSYPRVTVDIKWELRDQDDKDIVCALIPSKIS